MAYIEYFETPVRHEDGWCSDDACPCDDTPIPRGTGYLYVGKEAVEFRADARSMDALAEKIRRMEQAFEKSVVLHPSVAGGVLICEQAARRRGLDLRVAARDAAYWWKTGLVPLRPTPRDSAFVEVEQTETGLPRRPARRRWWRFWRRAPRAEPAGVSSGTDAAAEPGVRTFEGKTRRCLNCGSEFEDEAMECSACGSSRFVWE